MQRTVTSFTLAMLSLLVSYAIVAAWPDRSAPGSGVKPAVASPEAPLARTVVGLAD